MPPRFAEALLIAMVEAVVVEGQARAYGERTCGYMDGTTTCSEAAVRHQSVETLDACKELCDSEPGCTFVM
eukprot:COSAG06_NODE_61567_length_267_cov_0.857143_1_plen_70_part_10